MDWMNTTIADFTDALGSKQPTPGGGGASALVAASGAALISMVCELTIGRKKYEEYQEEVNAILGRVKQLQHLFLQGIEGDAIAFSTVSAAYALPSTTDEEKKHRKQAIQEALKVALEAPYQMMPYIIEALELTQKAIGKTNRTVLSDLAVAAVHLQAGLQGAWINVLINVVSMEDAQYAAPYRMQAEQWTSYGTALAQEIVSRVERALS